MQSVYVERRRKPPLRKRSLHPIVAMIICICSKSQKMTTEATDVQSCVGLCRENNKNNNHKHKIASIAAKIRQIIVIAGIEVFVLYRYIIQRILKGRIVSG